MAVELARRYSNNLGLLSGLTRTWRRIHGRQDTPADDLTLRSATLYPEQPQTLTRRLSADTIAALLADYQGGESSLELARRYGIGKTSVLRLLEQHGVRRRNQPLTQEQIARATALYESGHSVAAVADHLGVASRTVHRTLRKAGIPMRDTHGRPRVDKTPFPPHSVAPSNRDRHHRR